MFTAEVTQSQADTVTVLLEDTSGNPLTGLTATNVDPIYIRKDGGTLSSKSVSSSEFNEVDASNAPGVYEFSFSASDFDTLGEFIFVVPANGGVSLAQSFHRLDVVPEEPDVNLGPVLTELNNIDAVLERIKGLTQENMRITGHNYDSNNNLIGSTIKIYPSKSDTENETNPVAEYEMTASYDAKNRLTDYRLVKV